MAVALGYGSFTRFSPVRGARAHSSLHGQRCDSPEDFAYAWEKTEHECAVLASIYAFK